MLLSGRIWAILKDNLGYFEGGGAVNGQEFSRKQCNLEAGRTGALSRRHTHTHTRVTFLWKYKDIFNDLSSLHAYLRLLSVR